MAEATSETDKWNIGDTVDGVVEVTMSSWRSFLQLVEIKGLYNYPDYIWRGQRDAAWSLESSLNRLMKRNEVSNRKKFSKMHLRRIKQYACGRRGANPTKIDDGDDNGWWALGQHHGLCTPLLDWTRSPFVALFFAFCSNKKSDSGNRALWALQSRAVIHRSGKIKESGGLLSWPIEIVMPQQDDNSRLINQAGLFTKNDLYTSIDGWVRLHFSGAEEPNLVKVIIPDEERAECLKMLNRMNINYATLFPDLHGASMHCNMAAEIDNYDMNY